jgi:prepilin-type N-terminal cleavage/methylation domain-containing protein/prepilin-type processing-associated H-X9-DG protein
MPQNVPTNRRGFSLVELLVVVAIIGTLIGLLLPAVQSAREAGRRMSCQNNLRQIGIGFHNYETANKHFPTTVSISRGSRHNWTAQILPFMEENPLADLYDYSVPFSDAANQQAVQYPLDFMSCPSTPGGPLLDPQFKTGTPAWHSFAADYGGSVGPNKNQYDAPSVISYPKPANIHGFFGIDATIKSTGTLGRKVTHITDGTSKTVAVVESAGRPQVWYFGNVVPGSGTSGKASKKLYVPNSGWPKANNFFVHGYRLDLSQADPADQFDDPGPTMINGSNFYGIYAFHPGGAGLLFVDGSCRFMAEDASADVVAAALTIAGGEMVQLP